MLRIVLALCAAEVLTMAGVFAYPALLPLFAGQWSLSSTEAGWIAGITFAAYAAAVPLLSALTDRLDARRIWLGGAVAGGLGTLGFALVADGFWSALVFRALTGAGLAGTYMPGFRALVDRTTPGPRQARWMSWYTASFSLGTSASFLLAGMVEAAWGWRAAFLISAAAAVLGVAVVAAGVPPRAAGAPVPLSALLDVRPVLRDRPVMGYVLGYAAHMWELFALRSWMVAFLAFAVAQHPGAGPQPTTVATLAALVAMAGSIGGADLAVRFDRRRVCMLAALLSAAAAVGIGFSAPLPYAAVVGLMLLYNGLVQMDSAALTTGTVLAADPARHRPGRPFPDRLRRRLRRAAGIRGGAGRGRRRQFGLGPGLRLAGGGGGAGAAGVGALALTCARSVKTACPVRPIVPRPVNSDKQ